MTEDDTFNALRRTPFLEMYEILLKNSDKMSLNNPVLKKHGWTREEYNKVKYSTSLDILSDIKKRVYLSGRRFR